jgi:DNA-directed RNA polymerase subunit F
VDLIVKELVENFEVDEEEAVQIVNAMPESIQEIRVFLAGGRKIIETSILEKILVFLNKYRKKE